MSRVLRHAWVLLAAVPAAAQAPDALPGGFGTLRQDDVALRFETTGLRVTVLPLDDDVIRLLSVDTWSALSQLIAARQAEIDSAARRAGMETPSLFLVSFFAVDRGASFNPDALTIISRNQFFRPMAYVPITPSWSTRQLEQRHTAIAIFLFEPGISVWEAMEVRFAGVQNAAWEHTVRRLEQERAAVMARAAAAGDSTRRQP